MRTRRQRRRYLGFLMVSLIALLALIVAGVTFLVFNRDRVSMANFEQSRRYISADDSVRADVMLEDLMATPKMKIKQSITHPIFMSTRKPYVAPPPPPKPKVAKKPAPPAPEPEPEPPTPPLTESLSGIIVQGGTSIALMNSPSGGLRLQEGMMYKGWRVVKITTDHVELSDGRETDTKFLRKFATQKAGQSPIILE